MFEKQIENEYPEREPSTATNQNEGAEIRRSDFDYFSRMEYSKSERGSDALFGKLAEITHDAEGVLKKTKKYRLTALSQIKTLTEYEITRLEYKMNLERYRYSADPNAGEKHERNIKRRMRAVRFQSMRSWIFENSDQRRYLKAMSITADTRGLSISCRTDVLNKRKAELLLLLEEREKIERELSELYAEKYREYIGAAKNKKHLKIKLRAARKAYKRYQELSKSVSKYIFSPDDKIRLYEYINRSIELSSEIAVLKYESKIFNTNGMSRAEQKREIHDKKRERARAERNVSALLNKARRRTYFYGENGIMRWLIGLSIFVAIIIALFCIFYEPIANMIGG